VYLIILPLAGALGYMQQNADTCTFCERADRLMFRPLWFLTGPLFMLTLQQSVTVCLLKTGISLDAVLMKSILDCAIVILFLILFSIMLELSSESVELSRSDIKTAAIVRLFKSCSSILGFVSVRSSDSFWSMSVCFVDSDSSPVSTAREVLSIVGTDMSNLNLCLIDIKLDRSLIENFDTWDQWS